MAGSCNARELLSGSGSAMLTTPGAASVGHGLTRAEAAPLQRIEDEDEFEDEYDLAAANSALRPVQA